MQVKVTGETPFKCLKSSMAIGPTSSGYTLNYAVTKEGPWTAYDEASPSDECVVVTGMVPYLWFKLDGVGDEEEVEVIL